MHHHNLFTQQKHSFIRTMERPNTNTSTHPHANNPNTLGNVLKKRKRDAISSDQFTELERLEAIDIQKEMGKQADLGWSLLVTREETRAYAARMIRWLDANGLAISEGGFGHGVDIWVRGDPAAEELVKKWGSDPEKYAKERGVTLGVARTAFAPTPAKRARKSPPLRALRPANGANSIKELVRISRGPPPIVHRGTACDVPKTPLPEHDSTTLEVYTDASFNKRLGKHGYGACSLRPEGTYVFSVWPIEKASDLPPQLELTQERGGRSDYLSSPKLELAAAVHILHMACEGANPRRFTQLTLYVDCQGVYEWLEDAWRAKQPMIQDLKIQGMRHIATLRERGVAVVFKWVKSHSGNKGNNMADRLASGKAINGMPLEDLF